MLFDILTTKVSIFSMAVTNAKKPVVLKFCKVFDCKEIVLVRLKRHVGLVSTTRFSSIDLNWILNGLGHLWRVAERKGPFREAKLKIRFDIGIEGIRFMSNSSFTLFLRTSFF